MMDVMWTVFSELLAAVGVWVVLGLVAWGLVTSWGFLKERFWGPAADPLHGVATCADLDVVSVERFSFQKKLSYVVVLRSPLGTEFHVRVTTLPDGHPLYSQDADLNVSLYHQHHSDLARMLIARAEGVVRGQVWESAKRDVLLERTGAPGEKGLPWPC